MSHWFGRVGFRGGEEGAAMRKLWHDPTEERRAKQEFLFLVFKQVR